MEAFERVPRIATQFVEYYAVYGSGDVLQDIDEETCFIYVRFGVIGYLLFGINIDDGWWMATQCSIAFASHPLCGEWTLPAERVVSVLRWWYRFVYSRRDLSDKMSEESVFGTLKDGHGLRDEMKKVTST